MLYYYPEHLLRNGFMPKLVLFAAGCVNLNDNEMPDIKTVCRTLDVNQELITLFSMEPVSIKCPVAGKFRFDQSGDIPFETRIRGGVTQIPRPNVYCKENISDFSVCDKDQKIILIDANYCISVDYYGRPVDIYNHVILTQENGALEDEPEE
ncbi:hypothetical protein HPB48_022822 [Haemaphysalis longicornis]|uniref:Uncharacterized protein n=1 Tax=Haemaphysalis longicornis TaxID=44386 RepID=A0A9J6FT95_HAELO|nr:hypothetical protein HPB48_022822 [Haemaphysalis longicornis]